MKLEFLYVANNDLLKILEFHPYKDQEIVDKILSDIERLVKPPKLGASLSYKIKEETKYCYMVSSKFVVIYQISKETVLIVRVFDGRQDWLNLMKF